MTGLALMFYIVDKSWLLRGGRGWSLRRGRRLLGDLLRGGPGGGGFGGHRCLDRALDSFQFLHCFIAGIDRALAMAVVVLLGIFQVGFDPF